jgi:hypothetical protein
MGQKAKVVVEGPYGQCITNYDGTRE